MVMAAFKLPHEFQYEVTTNNRYHIPKINYCGRNYELMCTNGFVKLYTLEGRVYWVMQSLRTRNQAPDWKFHVSVKKEHIPVAFDIVAECFISCKCLSAMKCLFLKDYIEINVAPGREITIYIYRFHPAYKEGFPVKEDGKETVLSLDKSTEQSWQFWIEVAKKIEEKLRAAKILTNGLAAGDLKIQGFEYISLRNESFVEYEKVQHDGLAYLDYQYPRDSDGWNGSNLLPPFMEKMTRLSKLNIFGGGWIICNNILQERKESRRRNLIVLIFSGIIISVTIGMMYQKMQLGRGG